jgi:hypothetical protein
MIERYSRDKTLPIPERRRSAGRRHDDYRTRKPDRLVIGMCIGALAMIAFYVIASVVVRVVI